MIDIFEVMNSMVSQIKQHNSRLKLLTSEQGIQKLDGAVWADNYWIRVF